MNHDEFGVWHKQFYEFLLRLFTLPNINQPYGIQLKKNILTKIKGNISKKFNIVISQCRINVCYRWGATLLLM